MMYAVHHYESIFQLTHTLCFTVYITYLSVHYIQHYTLKLPIEHKSIIETFLNALEIAIYIIHFVVVLH